MQQEKFDTLRPNKEREPYLTVAMKAIPAFDVTLFGMGIYYLGMAEGGLLGWAKLIVFCAAAYAVSYVILRLTIEKGVPLVAARSKVAAPLSAFLIALVGLGFFSITAPGFTIGAVEESRLNTFIEQLGSYADVRVSVADQAAELVPITQTMAQDISARTDQESASGFGPLAQTWVSLRGRVDGLATQMTASLGVRDELLGRIQAQRIAMETTLADENINIWDRRAELRTQQARLMSMLTELDQAVPVSVVRSYVRELEGGVLVPNRVDANAQINRTLAGYSETLIAALSDQRGVSSTPPAFPSKTGALDTFAYIGKFAPVFLFAFIVDMVFPLALWSFVLMTMIAHSPQVWSKPRKLTDLDRLTGMRAMSARQMRELIEDQDDDDLAIPDDVRPDAPLRPPFRPNRKTRN